MMRFVSFFRRHFLALAVCATGLCAFSWLVIGSFSDWYFPGESVAFEYINRFWGENFRFFRIPHFEWHSDYFLYPYGCDITFIFWAFEMNIFGSFVTKLFGCGPWAQWYYVFSLVVTFFGTYALLLNRRGRGWSIFFAFLLTFCNYASICKFPGHFTHCIVHWALLSVLFDVVTIEKFWSRERLSARFVLTRILVLLLCFGLELGYIAGFACFSFFVTFVYVLCAEMIRERSVAAPVGMARDVLRSFGASTRWNVVLLCAIALVAWVYLPIVLQITLNAPADVGNERVWGTNPWRIFMPILPWFNPAIEHPTFSKDVVDTIYAWNAGLGILLMFFVGVFLGGRKNVKMWVPFFVIIVLAMVMKWVPLLRLFPAFKCSRIPERFSPYLVVFLLIPFYYSCKSLVIGRLRFRKSVFAGAVGLKSLLLALPLLALFCVEIPTAYTKTLKWLSITPLTRPGDDYTDAVQKVKALPGEALFFMPFTAHGGNGQGFMVEYHSLTAPQMQFAARCQKKINGVYLGRWVDEYAKDFSLMNWNRYIGKKVWSKKQWQGLEQFFRNSDFCAVVMATTILTPEQRADIIAHVGEPVAKFSNLGCQYEVIPMPEYLHGHKNLAEIRKITCSRELEELGTEPGYFREDLPSVALVKGFSPREPWGVWTADKTCRMRVAVPKRETSARIVFNAHAFVRMKTADVYCGDRKLAEWKVAVQPFAPADYAVDIPQDLTGREIELRIEQHDAVRPCDIGLSDDPRALGLGFISVRLAEGG